jgi:hypothetical protein
MSRAPQYSGPASNRRKSLTRTTLSCCLFSLLAGFFSGGCWSAPLRLTVRTVEDTVALHRFPMATTFTVTAIARNDDSRTLLLAMCGTGAQRDIDGTWTTLFTPACMSQGLTPVAPGDSVVVPVHVTGYSPASNTYPVLDPRMGPGRYRVVFGVFLGDPQNPRRLSAGQSQPSVPFIVKW